MAFSCQEQPLWPLPANVEVGDKVTGPPDPDGNPIPGVVCYIPSHRRFGVVRYTVELHSLWGKKVLYTFREALPIRPGD